MKFVKLQFTLELEHGHEVMIPSQLSQSILPNSFRFYDPIIKITQNLMPNGKKIKLNMQQSIIKQLSKEFSVLG
tara:strand:- start:19 stop:240 length:222 start_codon:yes stop_codon:yes gene_type:complete